MPPRHKIAPLPRLQRFLSECGVASRRNAEELILAGKVTVNGAVITQLGTRVDPEHAVIRVSNRIVKAAPKGVILLNKPTGVVTTLSDPEGRRTVADYLTKHYRSYFPVGRLDYDSSGLVILTNDGDLANQLLHPRYEIERIYHARVEGYPNQKTLATLEKGITLSDGPVSCTAMILERNEDFTWLEVKINEGRNRIVRRIFDFIGHPVEKLKRVSHGPCKLATLRPGAVRKLTEKEYQRLKRAVAQQVKANSHQTDHKPAADKRTHHQPSEMIRKKGPKPSFGRRPIKNRPSSFGDGSNKRYLTKQTSRPRTSRDKNPNSWNEDTGSTLRQPRDRKISEATIKTAATRRTSKISKVGHTSRPLRSSKPTQKSTRPQSRPKKIHGAYPKASTR